MNISIEEMPREIARLEDENELLQDRINKAIEYTEGVLKESWYGGREKDIAKELLEVLKGEE